MQGLNNDTDLLKKGIVATVIYAFIMSIMGLAAKQVQQDIAVPVLVFWQSIFCIVLLYPQMRGRWQRRPISVWKIHLLRGVGGFSGFLFYYLALNHIPLVEATLLRYCAPLCVPFVVLLMHKITIPRARWLPLVIGFVGVALVIQPSLNSIEAWQLIGLLSAVGLAFSMVTTRMLSQQVSGQETMIVYFIISALLSVVLVVMGGNSLVLPMSTWLLVLVVCITLYAGMYLYTKAYTYAPASVVSPVSYVGIVFSGFWGWAIWGHVPNSLAVLGIVLIFFSVLISARMARRR